MIHISEIQQGEWRGRLVGANGEDVFRTEAYPSFSKAVEAVSLVAELAPYRVSVEHADGRVETLRNVASCKQARYAASAKAALQGVFGAAAAPLFAERGKPS